jgi:hypothetical protein
MTRRRSDIIKELADLTAESEDYARVLEDINERRARLGRISYSDKMQAAWILDGECAVIGKRRAVVDVRIEEVESELGYVRREG